MPDETLAPDPRPTLAAPDDDPYRWLEEVEGAAALAWVERQNRITRERFEHPDSPGERAALTAILDRSDNIPFGRRRGGRLYNFWTDARNPRGLWRRTTLDRFRSAAPDWEILLDLDALAAAEGVDWLWSHAATLPGGHDRAMLHLSRGGSDAVVLREYDLGSKAFVASGFFLPEAKGSADWLDRDALLLSSAHGAGMATTSGYARTVRLWRRGVPVEEAPILFAAPAASMAVQASVDRTEAAETVWYSEQIGFFDAAYWLGDRTGPQVKLDLPTDIEVAAQRGWLAVKRRTAWEIGGRVHPPDTLLGLARADFLAGNRDFAVLFAPAERRALQHFSWIDGRLLLSILDELKPVFELLSPAAAGWSRRNLPGLPAIGTVDVWPLDALEEESDGALLASFQDPVTPPTLSLIEGAAAPMVLKRAPAVFDADGLRVTRHEAVSVDGVRIPYVQTGPDGETGAAPVHMTGYGGFGIPLRPAYKAGIGKLWLERGGTSVIANIRGGGEFGTPWHDAGRRAGKFLTHEDFAAVAADLVRRGVTRPDRIAAEGGSNGGILITNMLVRHPGRFGALFCTIPLIDMRRYTKLHAGASWIAEYGDPDRPEDWAFLQTYSAYHLARPGQAYPPILLATTRRDDRVHPGHARKMAAKLQAMGYEAYFYEPEAGGHGYGKDNRERAAFTVLGYTFLRDKIGWAGASHER